MRSSTRPATVYDFPDRTSHPRQSAERIYTPKPLPKGARHTLDEMLLGSAPVPAWLQQFSRGANARFTRTPDYLLKARYQKSREQADAPAAAEPAVACEIQHPPATESFIQPDNFETVAASEFFSPAEPADRAAWHPNQGYHNAAPYAPASVQPAPQPAFEPAPPIQAEAVADMAAPEPEHVGTEPNQTEAHAAFSQPEAAPVASSPFSLSLQASLPWGGFGLSTAVWAPTSVSADKATEAKSGEAPVPAAVSVPMDEPTDHHAHDTEPKMYFASTPAPAVPLARAPIVPPMPRRPLHEPPLIEAHRVPVAQPTVPAAPAPKAPVSAPVAAMPVAAPVTSHDKGNIAPDQGPVPPEPVAQAVAPSVELPAPAVQTPVTSPVAETVSIPANAEPATAQTNAPAAAQAGESLPGSAPWMAPVLARTLQPVAPVFSLVKSVANDDYAFQPAIVDAPTEQTARHEAQLQEEAREASSYRLPPLSLLTEPPLTEPCYELSAEYLDSMSEKLERTLRDFGVKGEIIDANPGPVVTLYELEPAPGTKLSRVVSVSSDIARSMSAVSARVAVVEGRNIIGIELPNQRRETVWLRELMSSPEFSDSKAKLPLCLGKTIGGEPVIADLARMPHLLVAGTTGSGKSVSINTMILSLLYKLSPQECRLIMIDPKMLELSVYEGIPHLLTPVVTDPKKAVVALKWAVRKMEERYRKMAHLGVRNIDGFNARLAEAREKGEVILRHVQTGFDRENGEPVFEEQAMDLTALPYIVVIVDEMADLMMVAGKEIEGAIQRLAQMARAAGIHIVMATQRPSVDVITGTIKANFPTRISFQVTSKIDSRTILGEMGAEQLLGQGDMLYMTGGGRIMRVHGPFVSDQEVEHVVAHLKEQGRPEYLDEVTSDEEEEGAPATASSASADDEAVFDSSEFGEDGGELYEQAVALVLRDRKASTSYIQRRLKIGYNRAASIMERMEAENIVGPANHAGKREILSYSRNH